MRFNSHELYYSIKNNKVDCLFSFFSLLIQFYGTKGPVCPADHELSYYVCTMYSKHTQTHGYEHKICLLRSFGNVCHKMQFHDKLS